MKRVLLVEDDKISGNAHQSALKDTGHDVVWRTTFDGALSALTENQNNPDTKFDAILLDQHLHPSQTMRNGKKQKSSKTGSALLENAKEKELLVGVTVFCNSNKTDKREEQARICADAGIAYYNHEGAGKIINHPESKSFQALGIETPQLPAGKFTPVRSASTASISSCSSL